MKDLFLSNLSRVWNALMNPDLHGIFRDGVILHKQPCNSERDPLVLLHQLVICSARAAKN